MSIWDSPVTELELSVRTANLVRRWKEDATIGELRDAYDAKVLYLVSSLSKRDTRDIEQVLDWCRAHENDVEPPTWSVETKQIVRVALDKAAVQARTDNMAFADGAALALARGFDALIDQLAKRR